MLYVENLVAIFRQVRRVLSEDGTLWLNIGDGYARNGGTGRCGPNAIVGNTKKLIQKRNCKVPDCWGLKDHDLLGMPWRVAFALKRMDGYCGRGSFGLKKTAMPESVKNRPSNATEEVFCSLSHQRTITIQRQYGRRVGKPPQLLDTRAGPKRKWAPCRVSQGTSSPLHPAWFP